MGCWDGQGNGMGAAAKPSGGKYIAALSDETGAVVESLSYDAHGKGQQPRRQP